MPQLGLRFRHAMLLTGLLGAAWPTDLRAATETFDAPGDLAGHFFLNANNNTVKYSQVASGGLANSGAVNILGANDADHTTAVYNRRTFAFSSSGDIVTISTFVRRQDAFITSTPFLMLGILGDSTERLDAGTTTNSYASIRIMPSTTATAADVFLQTEVKVSGGSRIRTTPGQVGTLAAGHWYKVTATLEYSSASDLLISAVLDDWGTSGMTFSANVFTFGPTLVSLSGADQVNGDTEVWAGFRGFAEGGSDLYDNFRAVPEPSSLLLILSALAAAARRPRPSLPCAG